MVSVAGNKWQFAAVGALLCGAAMTLSFAPFGWYVLGILCPALLFRLWLSTNPRQGFGYGWLFGLGFFGTGVSWVYASISVYGNLSAPLAVLATVFFVLLLSLYPALLGLLLARLPARSPSVDLLLVYPAAWLLMEWIRSQLFGGFPWLQPGYGQIDSPLAGFAPLGGGYLVTFVVLISAGLVALVSQVRSSRVWALGLLGCIWLTGWLLQGVSAHWTRETGKHLQVGLLQGNIAQRMRWDPEYLRHIVSEYTELTSMVGSADLVVWPENALPLFPDRLPAEFFPDLLRLVKGADFLIGMPVRDTQGRYYNAVVNPRGGEYLKSHLVPFGEFIPLKGFLGGLLDLLRVPMSDFTAGPAKQPAMELQNTRIGVSICFEDLFGEELIHSLPDAELLLNVSNDSWFGDTIAPHQHLQIARMRALETGRYLLRATNTGISAIIDAEGRIRARSDLFKRSVLRGAVELRTGSTPYVRTGNSLTLTLATVLFLLGVTRGRQRGKSAASAVRVD